MNINQEKNLLRRKMLINRKLINSNLKDEYDSIICDYLWQFIVNQDYVNIHCYIPMGEEINLIPLIEKMLLNNKSIITPKALTGGKMEHLILHSLDNLTNGVFGTKYPKNGQRFNGEYDLIIVPGLAFSEDGWRLGYGGGYYDRFLINHSNTYKLGICYPFQKMCQIPLEEHDIQLDEVFCPNNYD